MDGARRRGEENMWKESPAEHCWVGGISAAAKWLYHSTDACNFRACVAMLYTTCNEGIKTCRIIASPIAALIAVAELSTS